MSEPLISAAVSLLWPNSYARHWTKSMNSSQTTTTFQKDWRRWSPAVEWHRLPDPFPELPDHFLIIRLFSSVTMLIYVAPVENTKNVPFLGGFFLQKLSEDLKCRAVEAETALFSMSILFLPLIIILPCLCHVEDREFDKCCFQGSKLLSWKDMRYFMFKERVKWNVFSLLDFFFFICIQSQNVLFKKGGGLSFALIVKLCRLEQNTFLCTSSPFPASVTVLADVSDAVGPASSNPEAQSHNSCVAPSTFKGVSNLKLLSWIGCTLTAPPADALTSLGFHLHIQPAEDTRDTKETCRFTVYKALQCLQGGKLLSLCNKSSNCLFICDYPLSGPC